MGVELNYQAREVCKHWSIVRIGYRVLIYQSPLSSREVRGMSFNSNQFSVRWIDQDKKEHVKKYTNYLEADRAYRWLVKNGAEAVDIAVIQAAHRFSTISKELS